MKTAHVRFITLVVFGLVFSGLVDAEAQNLNRSDNFRNELGTASADSLRWFGSGATDATTSRHVDTLFSTGRDTTYAINIAGSEAIVLELHTRPGATADSVNVLYTFQVASSADTTAMWHSLSATYAAIPLTNTADTIAVVLKSPLFTAAQNDTNAVLALALAETGMRTVPLGDRALVAAARQLRVIMRSLAGATDTILVTGIPTVTYPR